MTLGRWRFRVAFAIVVRDRVGRVDCYRVLADTKVRLLLSHTRDEIIESTIVFV